MSTEFIKYDGDDGRSSKVFQNEEDSNYYGELEKEFQIGTTNTNNCRWCSKSIS